MHSPIGFASCGLTPGKLFRRPRFPPAHDEAWRFATIKLIELAGFTRPIPVGESIAAGFDQALRRQSRNRGPNDLRQRPAPFAGIAIHRSSSAGRDLAASRAGNRRARGICAKHFMTQEIVLGSKKFAALHQANVRAGTFLYVPKNVGSGPASRDLPLDAWPQLRRLPAYPHHRGRKQ